jgi:hypothetical protein
VRPPRVPDAAVSAVIMSNAVKNHAYSNLFHREKTIFRVVSTLWVAS